MSTKAELLRNKVKADNETERKKSTTQRKKEAEKMEKVAAGNNNMPIPKAKEKKPTKKETHKTFTAWVEKGQLSQWKAYIKTKGIKSEDLLTYAIQYYVDNVYPLTKEEQAEYKKNLQDIQENIDADLRKAGKSTQKPKGRTTKRRTAKR